jgi:hypothetical protein
MAHLTVSMAPNFTAFTCGPSEIRHGRLGGAIWPPLRTTDLDTCLSSCGGLSNERTGLSFVQPLSVIVTVVYSSGIQPGVREDI